MAPTRLNDTAHRRWNPLNGSWVLLASPHKIKRPQQNRNEVVADKETRLCDKKCYPGNTRAQGDRNPEYTNTFIFENDYSTVRMDEKQYDLDTRRTDSSQNIASDLLQAEPVIGQCYVLAYSPNHDFTISNMTPQEILRIIDVWTNVTICNYHGVITGYWFGGRDRCITGSGLDSY